MLNHLHHPLCIQINLARRSRVKLQVIRNQHSRHIPRARDKRPVIMTKVRAGQKDKVLASI